MRMKKLYYMQYMGPTATYSRELETTKDCKAKTLARSIAKNERIANYNIIRKMSNGKSMAVPS